MTHPSLCDKMKNSLWSIHPSLCDKMKMTLLWHVTWYDGCKIEPQVTYVTCDTHNDVCKEKESDASKRRGGEGIFWFLPFFPMCSHYVLNELSNSQRVPKFPKSFQMHSPKIFPIALGFYCVWYILTSGYPWRSDTICLCLQARVAAFGSQDLGFRTSINRHWVSLSGLRFQDLDKRALGFTLRTWVSGPRKLSILPSSYLFPVTFLCVQWSQTHARMQQVTLYIRLDHGCAHNFFSFW
jgi:hypothetical protein